MGRILPILFNTKMVRAVLEDRKTATRRLVKQSVWEDFVCERGKVIHFFDKKTDTLRGPVYKAPFQKGDVLYVRETWQYLYELDGNEQIVDGTGRYYYAASDAVPFDTYVDSSGLTRYKVPWRPSIHMPKEAARVWLKVTDVRAERLQDIDGDGCVAEGVERDALVISEDFAKGIFSGIWDSTVKKKDLSFYGWDANPWVWVIEFERCGKPKTCLRVAVEKELRRQGNYGK